MKSGCPVCSEHHCTNRAELIYPSYSDVRVVHGHVEPLESNTSSEVPSRTSSVSNVRHNLCDNAKMSEGPYLTKDRVVKPKEVSSPKKSSQITPR